MHWLGAVPAFRHRVVIAAPHPDDELLGCAGIMRWLGDHAFDVEIIAVTDGEASHSHSRCISPSELAGTRFKERRAALAQLGLGDVSVHRLGYPDADVNGNGSELEHELRSHLDAETTLVVPWARDGHPDHEAVARSGIAAARTAEAACFAVPIWARVRGDCCTPTYVLELGPFHVRKRAAAREYRSQLEPLGPLPVDGPVVHPDELDAMTSSTEWMVEVA